MTDGARLKLDSAVAESRLHAAVLADALSELPQRYAATDVAAIDTAQRRVLDQAAYRFMKLQDNLGERVLPGLLTVLQEPLPPEAPFGEKLQRLERLGALTSVATWRLLREVRNSLAHEYPENTVLQAAALSRLIRSVAELLGLWAGVDRYFSTHVANGAAIRPPDSGSGRL